MIAAQSTSEYDLPKTFTGHGRVRIIPVLDLKGSQVVRARQGQRDLYRPIVTPLANSSRPADVAAGLRTLHPFATFYCADLDAIASGAPTAEAMAQLGAMNEPPSLWVDAGLNSTPAFEIALAQPAIFPVLGTESQTVDTVLRNFRNHPRLILSLDFFADGYRGPATILDEPDSWPQTVIVMTLAKVGAAAGPDVERLQDIKSRAGGRTIVAAGGVRNEQDLRNLSSIGVETALVATSLHDGTLTAGQLKQLSV